MFGLLVPGRLVRMTTGAQQQLKQQLTPQLTPQLKQQLTAVAMSLNSRLLSLFFLCSSPPFLPSPPCFFSPFFFSCFTGGHVHGGGG